MRQRPGIESCRWDLIGVALATFLIGWGTTVPSGYFLHFDASNQNFMALGWSRGCWEYATEKMLPVWLLGVLFRFLGPTPYGEVALLLVMAAATVTLTYELTRLLSGSVWTALLAALLLTSLPAFQYFSRTHLGYVAPFLLLGWLAVRNRRWAWAGASFGLSIAAHFGFIVVAFLSAAALALFYLRRAKWHSWLAFLLAGIAPLLLIEAVFFAYMGRPFQWSRGVIGTGINWSGVRSFSVHPNWLWLPRIVVGSNGWLLSALLLPGPLAPFLFRRDKTALALSLSFLGSATVYALVAIGRPSFVSRAVAPLYPLWALCSAVALRWLIDRLPEISLRRVAASIVVMLLVASTVQTALFIRGFTHTANPQIGQWIEQAAHAGRPVRYLGIQYIGLFFAQIYGAEILTNDLRWIKSDTPGQAVLIFEGPAPDELSRRGYKVDMVEVAADADTVHPALTEEANLPRHVERWWPEGVSEPLKPSGDLPQYVIYYSGSGCVTPPAFGGGTMHFYQLVWSKILNGLRK